MVDEIIEISPPYNVYKTEKASEDMSESYFPKTPVQKPPDQTSMVSETYLSKSIPLQMLNAATSAQNMQCGSMTLGNRNSSGGFPQYMGMGMGMYSTTDSFSKSIYIYIYIYI